MKIALKFLLYGCILAFSCSVSANYTLQDVIDAEPRLANHTHSLLVSPLSGQIIQIRGQWYQIRLFSFELQPNLLPKYQAVTFIQFLQKYNLLMTTPKTSPEGLTPTDYFIAPRDFMDKGVYFLLSLRRIDDPKLIEEKAQSSTKKNRHKPKKLKLKGLASSTVTVHTHFHESGFIYPGSPLSRG